VTFSFTNPERVDDLFRSFDLVHSARARGGVGLRLALGSQRICKHSTTVTVDVS